jgi:hypothetical protein
MSTDWRTEIYAANLDFRRFTRGIQGTLRFEYLSNGVWSVLMEVKKGWSADYVVNQASGLPEIQIEIADQLNLADVLKGNGIQSLLVEGVRYEKRDQDLLLGVPRVWRLRCQPIGDLEEITPMLQRRLSREYVQ